MTTLDERLNYKFKDTPKGYDATVISVCGKYILIMPTIPVFYKYCVPMQYNHCKNFVNKYISDLKLPEKITGLIEYEIPKRPNGKSNHAIGGALSRNFIAYGDQIFRQNDISTIDIHTMWEYINKALKEYGGKTYSDYAGEYEQVD